MLKREVHHLGRELLQERTKVKALSEELENPLNVHRWRKLEGSDPSTFEMIQKIQTLQKRLISKTEEVVEKDLLIQEKEKLYMELKAILARQPGPRWPEQVSVYQQNLREKTRQLKAMASELNMYQAQTAEYKYEIERLTRDAQDLKRKYYEAKRREQLERERGYEAPEVKVAPHASTQARFAGGGFGLSKTLTLVARRRRATVVVILLRASTPARGFPRVHHSTFVLFGITRSKGYKCGPATKLAYWPSAEFMAPHTSMPICAAAFS